MQTTDDKRQKECTCQIQDDRYTQVFVSNTLQEDYVGLEEVADGVYDLYFCFY